MNRARSGPPVGVNCGWHGDKTEGGLPGCRGQPCSGVLLQLSEDV